MKNRRFPYGYKMEHGKIVTDAAEAETVRTIFSAYLAGENLKQIAESLTNRKIEYLPGECGWNKSRIKRMIEDRRYLGNAAYPAVIDADTFRRANAEKETRRTYTEPAVTAEDKQITGRVFCAECGVKLLHRTDRTQKNPEIWYCKGEQCKNGIPMTIAELRENITRILNRLIADPRLAEAPIQQPSFEPSTEVRRLENEIERGLESLDFKKETLQSMILQCAAKKYAEHPNRQYITDRLKADFEKSGPLSAFSAELFDRTTAAVILGRDRSVSLKLKNGKIIGKERTTHDKPSVGNA